MLIPYATDAPLYHGPWGTLGLIATNAAVFAYCGQPHEHMLWLGEGWHPTQWVTAAFLHGHILHLVGNMIFLWAYGLVVEGKLGWWRFLATYFLIAALQHALIQTVFGFAASDSEFDGPRAALGASGAISGLMAMAMLWAPVNDFQILYGYSLWGRFLAREGDISIWGFTLWYVGWDLFAAMLVGFQVSTPVLHLSGVLVGLALGVWLLRQNWVDCEGWDAFSVWSGKTGRRNDEYRGIHRDVPLASIPRPKPKKPKAAMAVGEDDDGESPQIKLLGRIRSGLKQNKATAALREWHRMRHVAPGFSLPEPDLLRLTDAAYQAQAWEDAIPLMEECLKRSPKLCGKLRVMLADVVLRVQRRPSYALRILDDGDLANLPDSLRTLAESVRTQAQQQIDDSLYELEGRAWSS
jgi:membrane associated rhomboid family serine protease